MALLLSLVGLSFSTPCGHEATVKPCQSKSGPNKGTWACKIRGPKVTLKSGVKTKYCPPNETAVKEFIGAFLGIASSSVVWNNNDDDSPSTAAIPIPPPTPKAPPRNPYASVKKKAVTIEATTVPTYTATQGRAVPVPSTTPTSRMAGTRTCHSPANNGPYDSLFAGYPPHQPNSPYIIQPLSQAIPIMPSALGSKGNGVPAKIPPAGAGKTITTTTAPSNCLVVPTAEQEHIYSHTKPPQRNSHVVRITAGAGAGKTTTVLTLAAKAARIGHSHITYLTFSKAAAADGQRRIAETLADVVVLPPPNANSNSNNGTPSPIHVEARTIHACAMKLLSEQRKEEHTTFQEETTTTQIGRHVSEEKLETFIRHVCQKEMDSFLAHARDEIATCKDQEKRNAMAGAAERQVLFFITKTLSSFCQSDVPLAQFKDPLYRRRNYYPATKFHEDTNGEGDKRGFPSIVYRNKVGQYADMACRVWDAATEQGIRTYDLEMKRAQLLALRIPGSLLLVDESQDLDGCQVDWISNQAIMYGTHIYLVGDAAQTIYSFRGAKSKHMMGVKDAKDCTLTKSWRFGPQIATIANAVLFAKEKSPQTTANEYSPIWRPYRVEGCGREGIVTADPIIPKWKEMPVTIIAAANATLMLTAVGMFGMSIPRANDGEKDGEDSMAVVESSESKSESSEENKALILMESSSSSQDLLAINNNNDDKMEDNDSKNDDDSPHVIAPSDEPSQDSTGSGPDATVSSLPENASNECSKPDDEESSTALEQGPHVNTPPEEPESSQDTAGTCPDAARASPSPESPFTAGSKDEPGGGTVPTVSPEVGSSSANAPSGISFPRIHINGKGENSGIKKWKSVIKQISIIYDLFKSKHEGAILPRDRFPEFQGQHLTWNTFLKEVENRELTRFAASISVVDKFRYKTLEAMELFEREVMDQNFKAEDADIILTTCHAAKGMEWDNVQVCHDLFSKLPKVINDGPLIVDQRAGKNNAKRSSWQFKMKSYGDDVNLLYVACTRAKKVLSIPSCIKTLLQDCDTLHDMLRCKKLYKEKDESKDSGISVLGLERSLTVRDALNLYQDLVFPLRKQNNLQTKDRLMNVLVKPLDGEEVSDDEDKALEGDDEFELYFKISQKVKAPIMAATTPNCKTEEPAAKKPKMASIFYLLREAKKAAALAPKGKIHLYDKTENAPTGKAKCRDCHEYIAEGTPRVGIQVYKPEYSQFWTSYFHNNAKCCPKEALKLLRLDPNLPQTTTKKKSSTSGGKSRSGYKKGGYYGGNGGRKKGFGKYWW